MIDHINRLYGLLIYTIGGDNHIGPKKFKGENNMRIGIDVDGVLTEIERYMWDYGSKYLHKLDKDINIDHTEYYTFNVFGWNQELDNDFWCKIYNEYCNNVPAKRFAAEVIKKLKQDGHEIYIITARGHDAYVADKDKKKSNKMLIKWLKNNKIKYDKLIFTGEDKLSFCVDNKIDIMIEDSPKNIRQLSKKLPMICMHADYNTNVRGKNITRCHSWYEVYDKLNKFSGNEG